LGKTALLPQLNKRKHLFLSSHLIILTAKLTRPSDQKNMTWSVGYNTIENLNRGIRKYTKTKVQFPDDQAALKAVYMAITNIEKKWSMPIQNWGYILHQFLTIFENRCRL